MPCRAAALTAQVIVSHSMGPNYIALLVQSIFTLHDSFPIYISQLTMTQPSAAAS